MKNHRYIFVMLIVIVSCSKDTVLIDAFDENISVKNGLVLFKNSKFSGIIQEKHENGVLKQEQIYVKGKLDGLQRSWYYNEQISMERFYEDGVKVGMHKGWWDNGNKKFVYEFNNDGEHHGAATEWFVNGTIYREFHYKNGKEEGSQKMYKPNGSIRANYVVINGERFGLIGLKTCDAVSTM